MELKIKNGIGLMEGFANIVNGKVEKGKLIIPKQYGKGYIRGFYFGPTMKMMIQDYELKSDLLVKRKGQANDEANVIFFFNNIFKSNLTKEYNATKLNSEKVQIPSVQVVSSNIDSEKFIESTIKYNSINIAISISYLKELINSELDNEILKTIAEHNQSFLFEELVSPAIQKVANEIANAKIQPGLQQFYFKLKAEELICLLFEELLKRENVNVASLNVNDVEIIYKIRDHIIHKLNEPPVISDLAKMAGFSESKLKRIFKQIFGNSIFNYYQSFRMQEAARLLKEQKLTVSEVGYHMGFSNLSHFGKLFEEHIGMKPKRYSSLAIHH
ncbi:MAG: AraC family transcriptional regulator [Bacteroidota bacterium]